MFFKQSGAHKAAVSVAGLTVMAIGLSACGAGDPESSDFPNQDITMIVPSAPGGGFDTSVRQLQPYLSEELGVNMAVENREGGQFAIGAQSLASAGDDCTTMMIHANPLLQFSYLAQDVDYSYDDFYPIGGYTIEPGVIRAGDHTGYESLNDLIEDARARPGEVRVSISGLTDNNHIAILQIQEATGVEFNIIPYDGGGPARTAVISGEVDWTHAGVFNSLGIQDSSRVLAVQQEENEWPEVTDDAPTVNEALGTDIPSNETTYGLYVTSACHEENPEQYQTLVDAFEAATSNEEFQQSLEDVGELSKLRVVAPEEYDQANRESESKLRELVDELREVSY